jgi:integrase
VWYWRIRLPEGFTHPDGTPKAEERKPVGPAWTGRGRTPDGYFTERTAKQALEARLTDLRRGVGIPTPGTSVTFRDAAEHWYANRSQQQEWKPSTRRDYRSALDIHLLPAFGERRLIDVTARAIESWRAEKLAAGAFKRRTAVKLTTMVHSIFEAARKAYGVQINPARDVEQLRIQYDPGDYDFYSPEEVWALVRAAEQQRPKSETPLTPEQEIMAAVAARQDAAIILTAAFTGLRLGELLALRVRDVDFPASVIRVMGSIDLREGVGTPKSGRGRSVPMVDEVARALSRLLDRERFTSDSDFVFVGVDGRYLDGSALRRRYRGAQKTAKLRPLRFHDLRHTFGSLAIREFGERDVQAFMGHADSRTTARYTHYKPRTGEAERLAGAFRVEQPRASSDAVAER